MGKTAAELGLSNQELVEDVESFETLPEEFSPRTPPPYPGDYVFDTPKDFTTLWDVFKSKVLKDPKDKNSEKIEKDFVNLIFDKENPLMIRKALGPEGVNSEGHAFQTRINNRPRARGKEKIQVSDMTYLLKALGYTGAVPKNNNEVMKAVNSVAGRSFVAAAEYSGLCNAKKQAYVQDDSNNIVPRVNLETGEEIKGCGKNIYFQDWPKVEGRYADVTLCPGCQAVIRPFSNLTRFRKVAS